MSPMFLQGAQLSVPSPMFVHKIPPHVRYQAWPPRALSLSSSKYILLQRNENPLAAFSWGAHLTVLKSYSLLSTQWSLPKVLRGSWGGWDQPTCRECSEPIEWYLQQTHHEDDNVLFLQLQWMLTGVPPQTSGLTGATEALFLPPSHCPYYCVQNSHIQHANTHIHTQNMRMLPK